METLLEVKNLKKYFNIRKGILPRGNIKVKAVDGMSFSIKKGETLGLVGESGSGKSTAGRSILRLLEPTEGEILYKGENVVNFRGEKLNDFRKRAQMIFQDPYASLNPRMRVGDAVMEPILSHRLMKRAEAFEKAVYLLDKVGLNRDYFQRFPHQFSGGQRQRIGIAKALSLQPELIISDEPVSALDVSVQAQIINLFKDLQEEYQFAHLFIAHDLSLVKYLSDRIAVMYLGEIVEISDKEKLFKNPLHPYSKALISAIPKPDPKARGKRIVLEGDIPSPSNPPSGCKFSSRCSYAMDMCKEDHPELIEKQEGHWVRCHLYNKGVGR